MAVGIITVENLGESFEVGVSVPDKVDVKFPTKRHGQAVKASSTGISGPINTFVDAALSVTLPGAGTYLVLLEAYVSASARVTTRLYNVTAGAPVANSERIGPWSNDGVTVVGPSCGSYLLTVAGATVIRLEAARDDSLACSVLSNVLGRTVLGFVRLA
jgi:hypothetical protein